MFTQKLYGSPARRTLTFLYCSLDLMRRDYWDEDGCRTVKA